MNERERQIARRFFKLGLVVPFGPIVSALLGITIGAAMVGWMPMTAVLWSFIATAFWCYLLFIASGKVETVP
jgi:hypothetical protein